MTHAIAVEQFVKTNFLKSSKEDDIKKLTLCTTRQDLRISESITIECFSPREREHKHKWEFENFTYQINNLGFREERTLVDTDIGAFGCSFTFGQGLPKQKLWYNLLSDSLSSYNFGQPASSVKSICDLFSIVTNIVQIKHAIFLFPPYHRLQISAKNKQTKNIDLIPLIPNYTSKLESTYELDGKEIYKSLPNEELLKIFKDAIYLIELIAESKGIKTYYSSWDNETYKLLKYVDGDLTILPEWTFGLIV